MSLVIAKQRNNKIAFVSDTKLTSTKPGRSNAAPEEGVIKCVILNEYLCIATAYEDDQGVDDIIGKCRDVNKDFAKVLDILTKFTKMRTGVEFIVGGCYGFCLLYEIKAGNCRKATDCWIGSKAGYSEFEKAFQEMGKGFFKYDFEYCTEKALKQVIEENKVDTVNGFVITVNNNSGVFHYKTALHIDILPQILPPGFSTMGHASAAAGGYTVHYFPSNAPYTALAIYVLQGNFGIIYRLRDKGLLYPEVFSNITEDEFGKICQQQGIYKIASTPPQR